MKNRISSNQKNNKRNSTVKRSSSTSRLSTLSKNRLRLLNFVILFALVGTLYLHFTMAALAQGWYGSIEKDQVNRINAHRASGHGQSSLQHIECLNTVAERWTAKMAAAGSISHNPNLGSDIDAYCGAGWTLGGENVGVGYDSAGLFNAFMASPLHHANIHDSRYSEVGVGAYVAKDGKLYVTQVFASCKGCGGTWNTNASVPSDPVVYVPPKITDYTHLLRNSNSGGAPDAANFKYGISTYRPLYCDWDGNGTDTPAMYENGRWYIRNSNTGGAPDITIDYGYAAATPVCGDWDGNGTDTIGVYDAGNWNLRNSNTPGTPHISFSYGYAAASPVVGDWDGNGTDTIGVYDAGNWNLRNSNTAGAPHASFTYGVKGYKPVVGDWDGNGTDTIGVYEGAGWWHLKNSNQAGAPNVSIQYGAAEYLPVVGDWNGDRISTIGVITK